MKRFEKCRYSDKQQGYFYYDNEKGGTASKQDYENQEQSNFVRFCMFSAIIISVLLFIYFS